MNVSGLSQRTKNFLRRLDRDESAPGTVEWILLVIVALVVLVGIYFIAKWVLSGGEEQARAVNDTRGQAQSAADTLKKLPTGGASGE